MVVYGLTVLVFSATESNSAVSLLLLTFLAPAVFFSAVAGVYVDRLDRRLILIVTNLLRAIFFAPRLRGRRQRGGDLRPEHRDLDGHHVLRAGRGGDDPGPRPAPPAARRERPVHVHPERRLRARVRAARAARREPGRTGGADPDRGRALPRRDGLHDHPAVGPADDRGADGRGGGPRHRAGGRPPCSASCAKGSATSAPTGTSPGRSSTSGSPPRSSASSASSVRTSPPRRSASPRRTSWSSSCRSGWAS